MTKRGFNSLMAYIEACQGHPTRLIELLRDAGLDELAEGIELGEVKFKPIDQHDLDMIYAATEFRRLGLSSSDREAVAKFAVEHNLGVDEFDDFVAGEGGRYQRLKKYLPQDLFPGIKRD